MTETNKIVNVAARLSVMAKQRPDEIAIAEPLNYGPDGKRKYKTITFAELDRDSDIIAAGLNDLGAGPGTRLALLVRPSIDFISLVFALFKSGVTTILIDPGMGRRNTIRCLSEAQPDGFVAIPAAHVIRTVCRRMFPKAKINVTVGRKLFWGGTTLAAIRRREWNGPVLHPTAGDDPAAIIFTTGSTGPPKGVLYRHINFDTQVEEIRDRFDIKPGEIDVPGFPMFGLFNCAMGVTAVLPEMDSSHPSSVDPKKFVEAILDWKATQTFASPAVFRKIGPYCKRYGIKLPTMRRVLSAGAPVPVPVVEAMRDAIHPEGDIFTPYGATEALPVAMISGREIIEETAERTKQGEGVCVGSRFSAITWKVIRITDEPIETIEQIEELPQGEIGELIVQGPQVTWEYCTRVESNALGKIKDGDQIWHRMGDVGYFDTKGRFWICGRKAHRLETEHETMFTLPCEAIFNEHPNVFRSALVGIGPKGKQRPVLIVEPDRESDPHIMTKQKRLIEELAEIASAHKLTKPIETFLVHPSFPVDIRHNAKIFREKLTVWAEKRL